MNKLTFAHTSSLVKGAVFPTLFVLGSLVFSIIILAPYLPQDTLLTFHIALTAVLLVTALLLRTSKEGKAFWPVCYALFVAGTAVLLSMLLAYLPLANRPGISGKLLSLTPWILLFVFSNGFMEELLFRGLFLKRYEPFLGKGLSNLLTAVVFALTHIQVTYAAQMLQFLLIVLVLSLIWGYLIQKTESLWGAALFHAAGDCLIIFAAYASI